MFLLNRKRPEVHLQVNSRLNHCKEPRTVPPSQRMSANLHPGRLLFSTYGLFFTVSLQNGCMQRAGGGGGVGK